LHCSRLANQTQKIPILEFVENVFTAFARCQDPGFPQTHQMLGNVRLPSSQHGLQVTDTSFLSRYSKQQADAKRIADHFEQTADLTAFGRGQHIQNREYVTRKPGHQVETHALASGGQIT
jgi:hypothetical protein